MSMQTPQVGIDNDIRGTRAGGALSLARERAGRLVSRFLRRHASHIDEVTRPLDMADLPDDETDRFRQTGLRPLDRRISVELAAPVRVEASIRPEGRADRGKPLRLFDWVLLGIEIAGALVVAWLVFQYIYTAYFDTAPRRISAPPATGVTKPNNGGVASTSTPRPTATPTRFAEVLPPLVVTGTPGDGLDGEAPLVGGPGGTEVVATATATPLPPTPTATIEPQLLLPTRLRIPVMFLDSPVREVHLNMGTWEVEPMDIGHHEGTGNPGEAGNVVLAGHRDINSALFRELDRLKPGDEVFVSNSLREYRYVVQESMVVGPQHTEVMDPTDDKRVTLITCTPIGLATQRLVVVATLDESYNGGTQR